MRIILQLSGGKDSHATAIEAVKKYGAKKLLAVYMDTVWEHPDLYLHIVFICKDLGIELVTLTSLKYDGMVGLAEKKNRFPAAKTRFCTEELKVKPFIDYILDVVKDDVIILQGIRKSESDARSLMDEQCTFFKYYFQPHSNNFMKLEKVNRTIKKLHRQNKDVPISKVNEKKKLIEKLTLGQIDNKFYTYRKEDVKKFVKKYAQDVIRPVFYKSGQEVIDIITGHGHEPFILYSEGFNRVGCFPCINEGMFGLYQLAIRYPERIDEIAEIEERLGSTFFTTGKIPKHACANGQYPTIREVVTYVKGLHATGNLFDDSNSGGCISHYSLCKT